MNVMIAILVALSGCHATQVCARPSAAPVAGDANGDGVADMADGTAVLTHLFRAGPALACEAAADVDLTDSIDAGDGVSLWYHLFTGRSAIPALASGACAKVERDEPECADGLSLAIDAPKSVTAADPVTVTLDPGGIDVESLAFGLQAEGCTIASARFVGSANDRRDGGDRDGGFARVDIGDHGLVAAIGWDIQGDAHLAKNAGVRSILEVSLSAGSCGTCSLAIADGVVGAGEPVTTVVGSGGYAYVPEMGSAKLEVCP